MTHLKPRKMEMMPERRGQAAQGTREKKGRIDRGRTHHLAQPMLTLEVDQAAEGVAAQEKTQRAW
jgi:hypothetical protein